ncbi:MAG: NAD(P)H-hydrate dehydratase [Deltaproteobacteria bacterium]|nr:MAG: NAD(P)H-hydrate dehydratase [Deltaproteobacteria bacterium]
MTAEVWLIGERDRVAGDARLNLEAWLGLGGKVTYVDEDLAPLGQALDTATLAVDGIFGTGLDRPVKGRYHDIIELLNRAPCPRVALDIPSGLDADTGQVLGTAVRADLTVTFGRHKLGLLQARDQVGILRVVGLGIPDEHLVETVGHTASVIEAQHVLATLGKRAADTHKYRSGNVLVIAGSAGKTGAALLSAHGALRCGGGMATIGSWPEAIDALAGRVEEIMTARLDRSALDETVDQALTKRKAVAIGPGLGLDDDARRLTERVVLGWKGPVVVDADAISHFAGRPETLQKAPGPRVLTPHSGELGRLLGSSSAAVEADRYAAAREAADRTGQTVVLKGPGSIVASDAGKRIAVCDIGSALLATAGSGDVLTGVIAALLCNGPAHEAACAGVYLHALAADCWHDAIGADRGMLAGEIAESLPLAIASLSDR